MGTRENEVKKSTSVFQRQQKEGKSREKKGDTVGYGSEDKISEVE